MIALFIVKRHGKEEKLTNEEFFKKYGGIIDPMYYRGAYGKHLITVDKEKIEITEV